MLRSKTILLLAVLAACSSPRAGDDDGGGGSADVGDYASDICTAFTDWTKAIQDRQTELAGGPPARRLAAGGQGRAPGLPRRRRRRERPARRGRRRGRHARHRERRGRRERATGRRAGRARPARRGAGERRRPADRQPAGVQRRPPTSSATTSGRALEGVGDGLQDIDTPELDEAIDDEEACQALASRPPGWAASTTMRRYGRSNPRPYCSAGGRVDGEPGSMTIRRSTRSP